MLALEMKKQEILRQLKEHKEAGASELCLNFYHGQIMLIDNLIEEQIKENSRFDKFNDVMIELNMYDETLHISKHSLMCKIATQIFAESTNETTNSSRYIYCDDIEKTYGLPEGFIDEDFMNDVEEVLYWLYGEQVAECEVIFEEGNKDKECDRCWSITLYHNYCVGIIEDDQAIEEYRD